MLPCPALLSPMLHHAWLAPQEAADLQQRAHEGSGTFSTAAELAALAARWQKRWPGPMARSASACLTVAGVREGLLEALDSTLKRGAGGTWQVHACEVLNATGKNVCASSVFARACMCMSDDYFSHSEPHNCQWRALPG